MAGIVARPSWRTARGRDGYGQRVEQRQSRRHREAVRLERLRQKLPELDRAKNYIPYCAVGLRSYVGHRILVQNGYKSKNLSGGFKTYLGAKEKIMEESPHTKLWLSE